MSKQNLQEENATPQQPEVDKIITSLGGPRLAPYRSFFGCATDEQVLGAYFWGQAIGGAFLPTLGMYEVTLRNAIHRAASRYSSKGASESHPWYDTTRTDALRIRGKTHDKVAELLYSGQPPLRRVSQPAPDVVVASLSFGFWPSVLAGLSKPEQTRIMTDAVPGHPKSHPRHWGVQSNVDALIDKLKGIQDLRNAVAHHEPIWKPHRLTGTEKNWSYSVASLRNKHKDILEVMAWCCPPSAAAVEQSYATRMLKSICSTNAVRRFMADPFGAGAMQLFEPPAALVEVAAHAQPPAANETVAVKAAGE